MRRREAASAAAALVGLPSWALPACSGMPAAPLKALTADDFRSAGQRGVGFGLLNAGMRSAADIDAVRDIGAGHVRVWVEPQREGTAYRVPQRQLDVLDALLDALAARGMYLMLTASFGADARDEMWRSPPLQDSAVEVWRQLARRLGGRTAVAGFDIVNEPVPPGWTYAQRQERWLDFAARIVRAVQAIDPQRVLIVESAPDATPESFENLTPLPFDRLVYSVHSYRPMEFTHQGVMPEFTQPRSYAEPGSDGRSAGKVLEEALDHVARFAKRYDVPIYVGEFSAARWAPVDSAARYVADSIVRFNRQGWSWSYHEFRTWHGWDPEIASPSQQARVRSGDAPVVRVLRAGLRAVAG